jgi:hypothetical protein
VRAAAQAKPRRHGRLEVSPASVSTLRVCDELFAQRVRSTSRPQRPVQEACVTRALAKQQKEQQQPQAMGLGCLGRFSNIQLKRLLEKHKGKVVPLAVPSSMDNAHEALQVRPQHASH